MSDDPWKVVKSLRFERAFKTLRKQDAVAARSVADTIRAILADPSAFDRKHFPPGRYLRKARGPWRVIYELDEISRTIVIRDLWCPQTI